MIHSSHDSFEILKSFKVIFWEIEQVMFVIKTEKTKYIV